MVVRKKIQHINLEKQTTAQQRPVLELTRAHAYTEKQCGHYYYYYYYYCYYYY